MEMHEGWRQLSAFPQSYSAYGGRVGAILAYCPAVVATAASHNSINIIRYLQ